MTAAAGVDLGRRVGPLWRGERGARLSSSPAAGEATIGLASGSGRASSVAAAAVVAAVPTINGVELWGVPSSRRVSATDFFAGSAAVAFSAHAVFGPLRCPGRTAADAVRLALNEPQQDEVGLFEGQLGVDARGEAPHGLARGRGPGAGDVALVAADPFQLLVELARQPRPIRTAG